MKKRIIVIEGLPGVGKSSILNYFHKDKMVCVVKEIIPLDPGFIKSMSQSFYFNSDELKTKAIISSDYPIYLLDRYYASTLAFYWAYDKTYKTEGYKKAYEWYVKALKECRLIKPFIVVFIRITPQVSFKRKKRVPSNGSEVPWLNKEFVKYFANYYNYFYRNIEPHTRVIKFSGAKPLHDTISKIQAIINNSRQGII